MLAGVTASRRVGKTKQQMPPTRASAGGNMLEFVVVHLFLLSFCVTILLGVMAMDAGWIHSLEEEYDLIGEGLLWALTAVAFVLAMFCLGHPSTEEWWIKWCLLPAMIVIGTIFVAVVRKRKQLDMRVSSCIAITFGTLWCLVLAAWLIRRAS